MNNQLAVDPTGQRTTGIDDHKTTGRLGLISKVSSRYEKNE